MKGVALAAMHREGRRGEVEATIAGHLLRIVGRLEGMAEVEMK
jgi:hypothetical protein